MQLNINMFYLLASVFAPLTWLFVYCFTSNFVNHYLTSNINDEIYGSNWYIYPLNLQKYLILILARSQRELNFTGFGLFRCTVEMFGRLKQCSIFFIHLNCETFLFSDQQNILLVLFGL